MAWTYQQVAACPHCGIRLLPHLGVFGAHVCADRDGWSQAERDAFRRWCSEAHPSVQFVARSDYARLPRRGA